MKKYQTPRILRVSLQLEICIQAQSCTSESLMGQHIAQIFDFRTCGSIVKAQSTGSAALFCMSGLEDLSTQLIGLTVTGSSGVSGKITGPCVITEPEFKGADVCEGLFYVCPMAETTLGNEQECLLSLQCNDQTLSACQDVNQEECLVVSAQANASAQGQEISAAVEKALE